MAKLITHFLLIITLLIVSTEIYSQNKSFEFVFDTDKDDVPYAIFEDTVNQNYIISGSSKEAYSKHEKGLFLRISLDGQFIDSSGISDASQSYFLHDILDGFNDSLVFCGAKYDSGSYVNCWYNSSLVYYILGQNYNPIDTLYYPLPKNYYYFQSYYRDISNGKRIILGSISDSSQHLIPRFYLYEFSPAFDSLKFIFYPDSTGSGQDIRLMPDNTYWILINGLSMWSPFYYLFDTDFNYISRYRVPNWITDPFGIKWDSDSTFYITGEWNGGPDDDIAFMHQLYSDPYDSDINLFNSWGTQDSLDLPAIRGGLDFNNNDSVFIGGMSLWYHHFQEAANWFFVLQTDSLLNIRWERFYGGEAYYTMWKLIATSDGGCISIGSRYDYQNNDVEERDIYVLKLNSEGLLVGNKENPAIEMREALVFPNPGNNYLKVRIAAQYKQSTFDLYDISGKQVLSQQINGKWGEVNTTFLKAGTYIYKIYNNDGLYESGKWVKQ